ncbi:hypothetical protein H9P43_000591 [Blastocladiella emersonii ATCC 22665]|nr:hypothetical protein H9P43_000591 [Blastocladiella emersonii ATCC 22665]
MSSMPIPTSATAPASGPSTSSTAVVGPHGAVSLKSKLPPWVVSAVSKAANFLFWPFIGGIMYGVGEVAAREYLARKAKWGVAPSAEAAVAQARIEADRRAARDEQQVAATLATQRIR